MELLENINQMDYVSMSVGFDIDRENRDREKEEELMNIIKDIAGD